MSNPKNYRKVPEWITAKLDMLNSPFVVAACAQKLPKAEIEAGKFTHLGITLEKGDIVCVKSFMPKYDAGRASKKNVEGEEIVLRDLPMVTKTFVVETPNYGDWSNGSHEVSMEREVYQREHVPPSENEISVELVGKEEADDNYIFRFAVTEVMDTKAGDFENRLLFNLNLLLENVGAADVFASEATMQEYLKTLFVNWEILPPGEREGNINRILSNLPEDPDIKKKVMDRYDFLAKLRPEAFIHGHGGFKRYFGAKFSDALVVFENVEYGNAIYVMYADWKEKSQQSRQELLATGQEGKTFTRIPHRERWKKEVQELLKKHLPN